MAEIAYRGTDFHGWQRQENAISVQEELENAFAPLAGDEIRVAGCGRTDTGVHASQYFLNFDAELKDERNFVYSANQILPASIAIKNLWKVPAETNARFDALSRTYHYKIHHRKDPFLEGLSWYHQKRFDLAAMNEAAKVLIETRDFASFCKNIAESNGTECNVEAAWFSDRGSFILFEIKANRFLRNMVRAIVGTLLEVGRGKMNLDEFKAVIEAKERSAAGFSVPAHGLYLQEVEYDRSAWEAVNSKGKKLGKEG